MTDWNRPYNFEKGLFADPAEDWDEDDGYEYDDTKPDAEPEEGYFAGVGLMLGEQGEMAIAIAPGDGVVEFYEVNDTEARGLSAMIDAVLG